MQSGCKISQNKWEVIKPILLNELLSMAIGSNSVSHMSKKHLEWFFGHVWYPTRMTWWMIIGRKSSVKFIFYAWLSTNDHLSVHSSSKITNLNPTSIFSFIFIVISYVTNKRCYKAQHLKEGKVISVAYNIFSHILVSCWEWFCYYQPMIFIFIFFR